MISSTSNNTVCSSSKWLQNKQVIAKKGAYAPSPLPLNLSLPCANVTCKGYFHIYAVTKYRMKSTTSFLISPNIVLHLCFILEFTIIIFILFLWISQLCYVVLENKKISLDIHVWLQSYSLDVNEIGGIRLFYKLWE